MPKYIIPIVYKGLENYIVEAKDTESAIEKAKTLFKSGEYGTALGNEYEEIDYVADNIEELSQGA